VPACRCRHNQPLRQCVRTGDNDELLHKRLPERYRTRAAMATGRCRSRYCVGWSTHCVRMRS